MFLEGNIGAPAHLDGFFHLAKRLQKSLTRL
jgi:hypothetical protein